MVTNPPDAGVRDVVAFALIDELIRTLVDTGILAPAEAAAMIDRVTSSLASTTDLETRDTAFPILHEMFREYRTR